jgi:hypothetical protein
MIDVTTALIAAVLVPLSAAQQSGWITGNPYQVNTTMCQWQSSRGWLSHGPLHGGADQRYTD